MTPETPLPDVARLLGAVTANMLDREPYELQTIVLTSARSYVVFLESEGTLDPITLQERLHRFVDCFLLAYKGERRA